MKNATKFLQANNAALKDKQNSPAPEVKTFLQTVDSNRILEVDKNVLHDLLQSKKFKDKLLKANKAATTNPEEIIKINKERKMVKKSVQVTQDLDGNNLVTVTRDIDKNIIEKTYPQGDGKKVFEFWSPNST